MKLIFQSDDYGMTRGVTEGILFAIENGIVKSTGLFTNMKWSKLAAERIKDIPNISVGIDINLVSGRPLCKPAEVPSLVDESGNLIRSSERAKMGIIEKVENGFPVFSKDPFEYDDVYKETKRQIEYFIEIMGRKPDYLHGHAIMTNVSEKVAKELAVEYGIKRTSDLMNDSRVTSVSWPWIARGMDIKSQLEMNIEDEWISELKKVLDKEIVYYICHCGFVDKELLDLSSFTLIRAHDLNVATSEKVKKFLTDNNIEVINHNEIFDELKIT